jgi:hypothetical protein
MDAESGAKLLLPPVLRQSPSHSLKPLISLHFKNFEGLLCQERVPVEHGAVPEMKEGPSEPACRGRLQTAVSCFGPKGRGGERYGHKA